MEKLSLQEWRARPRNAIALYPAMYTMEYLTSDAGEKEYGAKLQAIITVFTEKEWEVLLNSKEDYEKIGNFLLERFKKDPEYLKNLVLWSESQKNCLYDFVINNLNGDSIESLSNIQLAERYSQYVDLYLSYHFKNTPAWWVAPPFIDKEIKEYFKKFTSLEKSDEVISILTEALEYQTESFLEESSLLEIAIEAKEAGLNFVSDIESLPETLQKKFHSHVEEFSSMAFGYNTGIVWGNEHFLEHLNNLLQEDPFSLKNTRLQEKEEKMKKRDELFTSLNLPFEIVNLLYAVRQVSYLQELKKTTQTKSHPILSFIVKKEIAKRLGIEKDLVDYLTRDEIISFLTEKNISDTFLNELKERSRLCVHIIEDSKRTWLLGEDAKEFMRVNEIMGEVAVVTEIKGSVASRGKVVGKVKVCESSLEIGKIEEGDILVTAMTTPDFVPAMRKAAAIITNEGGITCHAAIVSRELGKPCITGTKIASKVLKDGDMVEVDAEKGIVRIMK